jgi:hypothetical protein
MRMLPSPPPQTLNWRRWVFAFVALSLLGGCANGDFGEVRPMMVRDDIHDWIGPYATGEKRAFPSLLDLADGEKRAFALTDDERQLRDLAYPLIEPPYDRHQWYAVAGEYGLIGFDRRSAFDRTAYTSRLLSSRYRSPSARYSQLSDDINNDTTRLPQFFETASRVLDIDQKRRKSLAYVSALSPAERKNTLRRIHENASIVSLVRKNLARRVSSYRFALERLIIMTPSPQTIEVERALNNLRDEIARYRTRGSPTWVREQSLAAAR